MPHENSLVQRVSVCTLTSATLNVMMCRKTMPWKIWCTISATHTDIHLLCHAVSQTLPTENSLVQYLWTTSVHTHTDVSFSKCHAALNRNASEKSLSQYQWTMSSTTKLTLKPSTLNVMLLHKTMPFKQSLSKCHCWEFNVPVPLQSVVYVWQYTNWHYSL